MTVLDDDCIEAVRLMVLHDGVCGAYVILQMTDHDKLVGPEPDASLPDTLRRLADALEKRARGRAN